ncbi:ABC transporter substrate-binding protein [Temperatibacter marinus]|uniref:ABC transporter substrate-binding protein n=1 Tax=Temperatibacter marinus TaxID=1456591 RepID=A0AA52EFH4_9PROT|nr:ABC transporter substrate-binding protein [Temperatibacter marinus]WND03826.1 ABC transporter substrate-binding protein [Temperatibacter marinus]
MVSCSALAEEISPDLVFGSSDRLNPKTRQASKIFMTSFCKEFNYTCHYVVMPVRRLEKAFDDGRVDVYMYKHKDPTLPWDATKLPFAKIDIIAIVRKESDIQSVKDLTNDRYLAWHRGEDLNQIFGFTGRSLELDNLPQGLKILKNRPLDALIESNSELLSLMSYKQLNEQGLRTIPILKNFELFPIMKKTTKKKSILLKLDQWLLAKHQDGTLKPIFIKLGFEDIYPFTS